MTAILAIDAAWTLSQPSGVALLEQQDESWKCLVVAPSYDQFIRECHGEAVNWNEVSCGSKPDAEALLDASNRLITGKGVQLVTIDMPVSQLTITGRRSADQDVSRAFGAMHCGTHSASTKRPGPLGAEITEEFAQLGYPVATTTTDSAAPRHLVEVYPHPALIRLLNAKQRLPYKVSKSNRYWPGTTVEERISRLLEVLNRILKALSERVSGIRLRVPEPSEVVALSSLKKYEDAIDALICAWVGVCYLAGRALPYGDERAAIWIPAEV